ncbi:C3 and PZP-like alpha-2-macroglobulin domain-containing protein 8 [Coccinella septempunctata]|uniref:C3 and PZP-like alpha-2-macroglobulin domain-containing protein 8 n=1 Tax=Coccinella septempunctata TaxID=41139 RepID=UPI001D090E62|nr:C3 and PZP-like alpha-2-macroglobulin domain-containing protein 8 [Coccinella septempunctata]XP_044761652.1 C3 and PZP-like alpha-2-macroglobulin domain-containing protein 8 [Coccinella septempunctata]
MKLTAFFTALLAIVMALDESVWAEDCTTGFSVVAPELAAPGKTTAVLVTLHGPASLQPLNVTLKLIPDPLENEESRITETTIEIRGHGILPLEVPSDATGNYILKTMVNCSSQLNEECSLQSSLQMRLVGPVRDVIVKPAKHAYKPGETVSFWVLALDHDLQLASGVIGTVSVKDPVGTKVAVWDQVSLDEGVKSFSFPLSEYIRSGRWLLQVEIESTEFLTPIDVAQSAGNGLPDVSAAEEHYVELRFGREMRRMYKPGLPFTGKVEAMSTEKSVRVRVKVYDNTTSIYSQDIEISNGEGRFIVPAILADSDVITLQAELVSVESKEIESHYVLAREPIRKWNSTSDCYLLIEGVENSLLPEEDAHVAILSTCPCERDLHYVITTDGQVTDWAQRRYEDPVPPSASPPSGAVCKLNFSFNVRSVMAPVSQLLVYYVTPQGEPVSDVISFDVKLLHKQVYVNMEEREWWLPNQPVDLEIVAEPSSLVCLLGGSSEMVGDIRFDPSKSEDYEHNSESGEIDFLEAGVSFFQRQCIKRGDSGLSAVSYRQRGSGAGPANRRRPPESLVGGTAYDQLWLWKCVNYTSRISSTGLSISAPQEAGKWSLWALSVSSGTGLRFSAPVQLKVYRPLQAEFRLPKSLRVRESLEVDIKIENNINSCMDVTALLALSEGAQFLSNGLLYVTERLRLGPRGATSLVVRLLVTTPGLKKMTVEINGYTSSSCEGSARSVNTTITGAVIRSATVNVHPEGLVQTDTESAYFCANENLLISTADKYHYEWMTAPRNRQGVVIELRIGNSPSRRVGPVHIALSDGQEISDRMYRIALGDADNKLSWIGRGKHGYAVQLNSTDTPEILSEEEWRTFWITWENDVILFGKGSVLKNNTLLTWKMDKKIRVQQLGFASSWLNLAEFRIWNFNEEAGFSQVLHLDTPKSLVPGTEWGQLTVTGGLSLPTPSKKPDSSSLTSALASLSSLMSLQHLGSSANETMKKRAFVDLSKNIQTILSYKKEDNSFSEHPMLGSHKVTISILEAITKIQAHIGVDPDLIQGVKRWVQLRQEDDGRFSPLPADIKLGLGQERSAARRNLTDDAAFFEHVTEMTAETVIVLYDIGIETETDSETIQKAKIYLENSLPNIESPEAIAAVALALILVKSATSAWAIEKLRNVSTTDDREFGWPHSITRKDAADWLYESATDKTSKEPLLTTTGEYKASIYALVTFATVGDLKLAENVARYLFYRSHMLDRHPELVYPAVKAFTLYDSLLKDRHRSLTISLATSGMELTDTLDLRNDKATQVLHLPSLPTKVFVYATGAGCATVQGRVIYSTYATKSDTPVLTISCTIAQEVPPDKSSIKKIEGKSPVLKTETCFRWKGQIPSGVLRMEITLFSGFELVQTSPQLISSPEIMAEMQHGSNSNNIWFIFANVSTSCPICVRFKAHSTFIISSLRPSYARIYPVGREDLAADTFFHTQDGNYLLNSITDDDLITWFGRNGTDGQELRANLPKECLPLTSTILDETTTDTVSSTEPNNTKTNEVESNDIPFQPRKKEVLSIATYTINVENGSINGERKLTKTEDEQSTVYHKFTTLSPPLLPNPETGNKEHMIQSNLIPDLILKKTSIQSQKLIETKTMNQVSVNKTKLVEKDKIYMKTNIDTTQETTTKPVQRSSEHGYLPKYVNTNVRESPIKYLNLKRTTETPKIVFIPEIKNDKYVLLDKEEIWSLLKEIVNDPKKFEGGTT